MPPVGTNETSRNGPARAFRTGMPPIASAGKNFTASAPARTAESTSVGVVAPGKTGTPAERQKAITSWFVAGETTNRAPASTTRSAASGVRTVPAPMSASGCERRSPLMAWMPASVRSVISAMAHPPAVSASRSGAASSASRSSTTGTTPTSAKALETLTSEACRRSALGGPEEGLDRAGLTQGVVAAEEERGVAGDRVGEVVELQAVGVRRVEPDLLDAVVPSQLDDGLVAMPRVVEEERSLGPDRLQFVP